MTNLITYEHGSDDITMFIQDCIKEGNNYLGSNAQPFGIKPNLFAIKWTLDVATPTYDEEGNLIGWNKKVSEMVEADPGEVIDPTSEEDFRKAIKMRSFLADKSYQDVENYIDSHVTNLTEAKSYLKLLSKIVLGIIKMMDKV